MKKDSYILISTSSKMSSNQKMIAINFSVYIEIKSIEINSIMRQKKILFL